MLEKRTEAQQAADKAAMRRMWRAYKAILGLPLLVLLILAFAFLGYAKGYLDGYMNRPTILQKDSTDDNPVQH